MKRIALSIGEPSGIGPDIAIKLCQHTLDCELILVGSEKLLKARAQMLDYDLHLSSYSAHTPYQSGNGHATIANVDLQDTCHPGILNAKNNEYVLTSLSLATQLVQDKICHALVTGPIHKGILSQQNQLFTGHTEYLQKLTGADESMMIFHHPDIIVGLVTTHIPLKDVSKAISAEQLGPKIRLLNRSLQTQFAITHPRIGILGLNPHAGESGQLGLEEMNEIIPCIEKLNAQGFHLEGPLPADTAFIPERLTHFDAMVAMYHDQGLIAVKTLDFQQSVNITLGLPIIRTSVDHGTALSLAGTRAADETNLARALHIALHMKSESNVDA